MFDLTFQRSTWVARIDNKVSYVLFAALRRRALWRSHQRTHGPERSDQTVPTTAEGLSWLHVPGPIDNRYAICGLALGREVHR